MKSTIQEYNKLPILISCSCVLSLILILQLSIPGFVFALGADNYCALSSFGNESSPASILCIEDVEDESMNFSSKSLSVFSLGESKFFSQNNDLPNDYTHCQLHSRSPPGT